MASLKQIRIRIKTVGGVDKITSAMKLISSVKFKKTQGVFLTARGFSDAFEAIIGRLDPLLIQDKAPLFLNPTGDGPSVIIVLTASRGLCGGFVSNVVRFLKKTIGPKDQLIIIGSRGRESLIKNYPCVESFEGMSGGLNLSFQQILLFTQHLFDAHKKNPFSKIGVISTHFKNMLIHPVLYTPLIPMVDPDHAHPPLIMEPKKPDFIQDLMISAIGAKLYALLVEHNVCEHAERMMAMDSASKNTSKLLRKLTLDYNRMRQQCITSELIEIISAADAV